MQNPGTATPLINVSPQWTKQKKNPNTQVDAWSQRRLRHFALAGTLLPSSPVGPVVLAAKPYHMCFVAPVCVCKHVCICIVIYMLNIALAIWA
jgi:hypothetical protein